MAQDRIEYVNEKGFKGVLYNLHDDWNGTEKLYEMSIYDPDGYEVTHAYNAAPKNLEDLKNVVNNEPGFLYFLRRMAELPIAEKGGADT